MLNYSKLVQYGFSNQSSQISYAEESSSKYQFDITKMMRIIIFVLLFSSIDCQQYEGSLCTLPERKSGTCTLLANCENAVNDLRIRRKQPQICGFISSGTLVCCPNINPTTTPKNFEPISTTVKNSPMIFDDENDIDEECKFPAHAITVKRNESSHKAWNKCIDLAESVFPCKTLGMIINQSKVRITSCAQPPAAQLIYGGEATKPNEFPHMAVLGYDNAENSTIDWDCGGSLISEQWVMTAAHCLYSRRLRTYVKYVRLGSGDLRIPTKPNFLFTVIRNVKHPGYSRLSVYNDIALLQLDKPVTYSKKIRPACLHVGNEVNDDEVIAIGYGITENNDAKSDILLKVKLNKFSYEDCSEKYPRGLRSRKGLLSETQMCYGSDDDIKDTCRGDSGSPVQIVNRGVYCTYTIIGITSVGQQICGIAGTPALYTRVSAFIPWIESVVWPN